MNKEKLLEIIKERIKENKECLKDCGSSSMSGASCIGAIEELKDLQTQIEQGELDE